MKKIIDDLINNKQFSKLILLLILIVFLSALLIRGISKGENLYDYAEKNSIPVHAIEEDK